MPIIPQLSVKGLKHIFWMRYKLASLTKRSKFFNKIASKFLFEGDYVVVVPKENTAKVRDIKTDISIDSAGDRTPLPRDVIDELVRSSNYIFIMNFCLCRNSNKCEDYPIDHGCVFMGKGIYRIPEEFGHVATPEEAIEYIDECRDLGLVQLIGRNKIDSVWLNTGDKKDLMTICNCCPCCCLWNMTRDVADNIGEVYKRMEGVNVSVNNDKCIGCGKCEKICFTKAIKMVDGKCTIDDHQCRGCGRCVNECDSDAISITYDESAIGNEIERIKQLVDLT